MSTRIEVEEAIRLWSKNFGLRQKELARRADVTPATISHLKNDPGWTRRPSIYRKICDVVAMEAGTRWSSVPMAVVSLCHGDWADFATAEEPVLKSIRSAMGQLTKEAPLSLPAGVKGALIQVGHSLSGLMLIAIPTATTNEGKLALAHELEHLRDSILKDIQREVSIPRSAF